MKLTFPLIVSAILICATMRIAEGDCYANEGAGCDHDYECCYAPCIIEEDKSFWDEAVSYVTKDGKCGKEA